MSRLINRLSARQVDLASTAGGYCDGAGLDLVVGTNGRKQWVFRYRLKGVRRDMGLGGAGKGGVSLAHARTLAAEARRRIAEGRDPLRERANGQAAERAASAASRVPTFGALADEVVSALEAGWRNPKHRAQWRMTLQTYCASLRSRRVDEIDTGDVVAVLKPIWLDKPETATRVRGRIEKVLDAAMARGHRQTANPARRRGHLDHLLPARPKIAPRHHPALPWTLIPSFVPALQARDGVAARGLEFLLLSATRSGEVRGALWDEIDLVTKIWTRWLLNAQQTSMRDGKMRARDKLQQSGAPASNAPWKKRPNQDLDGASRFANWPGPVIGTMRFSPGTHFGAVSS
jgi:hypothetical protein